MARKDYFHETPIFCVMCGGPIPADHKKMALTCSDKCRDARTDYRKSRQDARMCRYCFKPSTPEQRLAYRQWRRRPQNAEEEEQFRLWRIAQTSAAQLKSRHANKRKKLEEIDGRTGSDTEVDAGEPAESQAVEGDVSEGQTE